MVVVSQQVSPRGMMIAYGQYKRSIVVKKGMSFRWPSGRRVVRAVCAGQRSDTSVDRVVSAPSFLEKTHASLQGPQLVGIVFPVSSRRHCPGSKKKCRRILEVCGSHLAE